MKYAGCISKVLVLALTLSGVAACLVFAVERGFVEDFDSRQYCDTLNTTALWDTVAAELRLPAFDPTHVGSYDTPGSSYDAAVSGDYVYVADGIEGLQVIDISDPTTPSHAGAYNTSGIARGVTVFGDYAYVADGDYGLIVMTIDNPTNPTLAGSYDTPGTARCVSIAGDHAYVADGDSGLVVIDISSPAAPAYAGGYDTPGESWSVAIAGDYAFVADGSGSGLQVIDISDPTSPSFAGSSIFAGNTRDVAIAGDYAFVASNQDGLRVMDISDPATPVPVGSYNTPGAAGYIAVDGDRVYLGDSFGLQVIDIGDPTNPTYTAHYNTPGDAKGVAVAGNYAYVADYAPGLQVIKIADQVVPTFTGFCDAGTDYSVAIDGYFAFVTAASSGLQVIDISDPTEPTLAGIYDTPGVAYDVVVAGDYTFVADGDSGLQVIDVSDPTVPVLAGYYDAPGAAFGVTISGDFAYVGSGDSSLRVIDISDPAMPVLAGICSTPDVSRDVVIAGDYAYVGCRNLGLQVIDISDPTTPVLAGSCDTPNFAWGVAVSGDYAYLADASSGLQVVDISKPTAPSLVGSYDTPGFAMRLAVVGDLAYVGDYTSGLQVIDISDPTTPVLVGSYDTPGYARGVAVEGEYAYVADNPGVRVIQVYQRSVNPAHDVGQSLAVNSLKVNIDRVKLTDSTIGTVNWEASSDNGASWTPVSPGGAWFKITNPGDSLVWRSSLVYSDSQPAVNPTCLSADIGWIYDFAIIDSIVDVPEDQGGWARLYFTRSGKDFTDELTYPIAGYNICRRIENPALVKLVLTRGKPLSARPEQHEINAETTGLNPFISSHEDNRTLCLNGSYYSVTEELGASAPPGVWEIVGVVFAQQQEQYVCLVPTLGDSASTIPHSVYYVSAHTTTPSVYYSSFPDSGYSVDDIVPGVPEGFAVAYNTGSGNYLSWYPSVDPDFQYFKIYRGTDPNFTLAPDNLVHATAGTQWSDPEYDGWNVHYKITAMDHVGNESDAASPGTTTGITEPRIAKTFALYQNIPNPFNPTTVIRYDVPSNGGKLTLCIYDVHGRVVRTLVDGVQSSGEKRAVWYGRDNRGNSVASGVYLYRLKAGNKVLTRKMVLLK